MHHFTSYCRIFPLSVAGEIYAEGSFANEAKRLEIRRLRYKIGRDHKLGIAFL